MRRTRVKPPIPALGADLSIACVRAAVSRAQSPLPEIRTGHGGKSATLVGNAGQNVRSAASGRRSVRHPILD